MNLYQLGQDLKPFLLALLLPPVPFLVLMLLGAALLTGRRWLGRLALGLGTLGVWLSCTEGFAQLLAQELVKATPALSAASLAELRAQSLAGESLAVLVLGGGARPHVPEYQGPALKTLSEERLRYGVWLARQINAPLGFSGGIGWNAPRHMDVSEAALAQASAKNDYGLPLRWAEGRSRDTRENAELSLALLRAAGIRKLVLVTHDLHMPRAMRAFSQFLQASGGSMILVAAPIGASRDNASDWQDWCPSMEGLPRVRYAVYEWLGQVTGH